MKLKSLLVGAMIFFVLSLNLKATRFQDEIKGITVRPTVNKEAVQSINKLMRFQVGDWIAIGAFTAAVVTFGYISVTTFKPVDGRKDR